MNPGLLLLLLRSIREGQPTLANGTGICHGAYPRDAYRMIFLQISADRRPTDLQWTAVRAIARGCPMSSTIVTPVHWKTIERLDEGFCVPFLGAAVNIRCCEYDEQGLPAGADHLYV